MAEFAPELVEQAIARIYDTYGQQDHDRSRSIVLAVLTAVAPTLRAEGVQRCEHGEFVRVDTAEKQYQRGMVEGARQVLAEVETEAEKFDLYTNIAEKVADAAREAVARIEKGGA